MKRPKDMKMSIELGDGVWAGLTDDETSISIGTDSWHQYVIPIDDLVDVIRVMKGKSSKYPDPLPMPVEVEEIKQAFARRRILP